MNSEKIIEAFVKIYENRFNYLESPVSELALEFIEEFGLEGNDELEITIKGFINICTLNYNDSIVEMRMVDEFLIANIDHCYLPDSHILSNFTDYYYNKLGKD